MSVKGEYLKIETDPPGATIVIDDHTVYNGNMRIATGVHSLLVSKPGYQTELTSVDVVQGSEMKITILLKRKSRQSPQDGRYDATSERRHGQDQY